MCQIFTVQKYRFGNIISTPREMCVHELYTIDSSNMTWKMKTSTRTINNYYSNQGRTQQDVESATQNYILRLPIHNNTITQSTCSAF